MTSPYLLRVRSPREAIEALIAKREEELARVRDPSERHKIEETIVFLRAELARAGG